MGKLFETGMLICFGLSWPISVRKSWKSRTARGKSIVFSLFVLLGYTLAIIGKLVTNNLNYVLLFYALNWMMVCCDTILCVRNMRLDRLADEAGTESGAE